MIAIELGSTAQRRRMTAQEMTACRHSGDNFHRSAGYYDGKSRKFRFFRSACSRIDQQHRAMHRIQGERMMSIARFHWPNRLVRISAFSPVSVCASITSAWIFGRGRNYPDFLGKSRDQDTGEVRGCSRRTRRLLRTRPWTGCTYRRLSERDQRHDDAARQI